MDDDLPPRGFLKMGAVVGAFPADMGERCIHFFYEFCDMKTWFILLGELRGWETSPTLRQA